MLKAFIRRKKPRHCVPHTVKPFLAKIIAHIYDKLENGVNMRPKG